MLERGEVPLVFGMGLIMILVALSGYVFDVGRIGLAQVRAQNTLDLAAEKAGNAIDIPYFKVNQGVVLGSQAQQVALSTIAGAPKQGYNLSVTSVTLLDGGNYM